MKLDDTTKEVIKRVAEKNSLPETEVLEAIDFFLEDFTTTFREEEYRKYMIHNFGTFIPSEKLLRRMIYRMKEKGNQEFEDVLVEHLEKLNNNKHVRND